MICTIPPDVDRNRSDLIGTGGRPIVQMIASTDFHHAGKLPSHISMEGIVASSPTINRDLVGADTSVVSINVPVSRDNMKWGREFQKEYDKLALKEAFNEASADELARLNDLQSIRRADVCPRSAEEIILEFERRKALRTMMQAMLSYLEIVRENQGADKAPTESRS